MSGGPLSCFSKQGILLLSILHYEPISKVVIQKEITLLANQSCSVWLLCNVSVGSNLSYTWERGNETYRDDEQIHFSLSPADGDISVTCNASNTVSEKSASVTVKCSNDTTIPGLVWYIVCIVVVLTLIVGVPVYCCRGRCNMVYQNDKTIYADVMGSTINKDTRGTVDDLAEPRLNKPQTLYDEIKVGHP
ncbi:SLAM family member 8-like isoform X4 [Oncorhynchus masou masou]|uniref:SLAM family member 8-like isoform X4 n=1 Tax=Oncorhynchus masou masou TaxID=90313 RepID=UPI003183F14B